MVRVVRVACTVGWLQTRSLDSLAEAALLAFAIKALHAVLDLIDGLLLSVETFNTNQVERITYQVALDRHVEGGVSGQGWTKVDLNEPGLQIRVDKDVEAE